MAKLDDFQLLRLLGEGGFGKVHAVQKYTTGTLYAMKVSGKLQVLKRKRLENVLCEVDMLKLCSGHPFVMNLLYGFDDDVYIYLVLDLCLGGELGKVQSIALQY